MSIGTQAPRDIVGRLQFALDSASARFQQIDNMLILLADTYGHRDANDPVFRNALTVASELAEIGCADVQHALKI